MNSNAIAATVGNKTPISAFDQGILQLIQESWAGTGLEGLLHFQDKLTKSTKNLTPSQTQSLIHQVQTDIQNPDFLSFQSWTRDEKVFGFEGVGTDVIPTLTPNGDCIIPVNFWRDGQRRTLLLIIHVKFDSSVPIYHLPEWENRYILHINNQQFTYQLLKTEKGFNMRLFQK